jgi:hypothetical protein
MKLRLHLAVMLALVSSCSPAPHASRGSYALALTGPAGPFKNAALVTATPAPADGTVAVSFLVDGVQTSLVTASPFTATLDFSHAWGGTHHVTAIAGRDDGASAEAAIDVTYDPLGPAVNVIAPQMGAHVTPEGGVLDISIHASDPGGLAAGEVRLDDAPPVPIPLPSLTFSVPLAAVKDLPASTKLSWWLADAAGNRTEGTIPLVRTHERFSAPAADSMPVFETPDGHVEVVSPTAIQSYDVGGHVAWSLPAGPVIYVGALPAKGGDLLLVEETQVNPVVERVRADGSSAWTWPTVPSTSIVAATYLAAGDSLVGVRSQTDFTDVVAVLVDGAGHESPLATYPYQQSILALATPDGAPSAGFAVISPGDSAVATADIYDPAGALAWSASPVSAYPLPLLLTRDALLGEFDASGQFAIQGPGGLVAALGAISTYQAAPNGDALIVGLPPAGADTVTRLRPDGSVVWETKMDGAVMAVSAAGDRVAVAAGASVRFVDAAGGTIDWKREPDDDGWTPAITTAAFSPSGAFYLTGQLANLNQRVYRVNADGTTRWHETLHEQGLVVLGSNAPGDERLVVEVTSVPGKAPRAHVFEP